MGAGIAQVAATAGLPVVLYELNAPVLEKSKATTEKSLQALTEKGKLPPGEAGAIMDRIIFTNDLSQCRADLVIEAIIEKPAAKMALFRALEAVNEPDTILASNTSSLSITELAKGVQRPGQFAGLHFFNPAPLMKLVEVVRGEQTDPDVVTTLVALTRSFGKTPVLCRDAPGFIVNRVARPYYIESLRLAEAGHSFDTIDRLLEARGFRMGPFRLMDLIGNDINYAVSCSVHEQLGKPERLQPSAIQKERVDSGALGKKTGKGYYGYE